MLPFSKYVGVSEVVNHSHPGLRGNRVKQCRLACRGTNLFHQLKPLVQLSRLVVYPVALQCHCDAVFGVT
jgi:hypothetical protein